MADFEDSNFDGDTPQVQGGLLDPATFPTNGAQPGADLQPAGSLAPGDQTGIGDEWLERPPTLIKRSLDADTHAEVLRDIQDAQAKLPPISNPQDALSAVFGKGYSVLQAGGSFDPARLNGVTSIPSADEVAAGVAGAPTVAVTNGGPERMAYMVPMPTAPTLADVDPSTGLISIVRTKPTLFMPSSPQIKTTSEPHLDTASALPSPNALALEHGHIDGTSEGFVDAPTPGKYPYGDTQSLSLPNPFPTATVSDGKVGWHVLDNGRLKFVYPNGSMSPEQIEGMQQNLNQEQQLFLRPK